MSPHLKELVCYIGQSECYQASSELLEKTTQIEVDDNTIHRLCNEIGEECKTWLEEDSLKPVKVEKIKEDEVSYNPIPSDTNRYIWFHDSIVEGKTPLISSFRFELEVGIKSQNSNRPLITTVDIEFIYSEDKDLLITNQDGTLRYKNLKDFVDRIQKENWSDNVIEEDFPSQILITFPNDTLWGYFSPLHLESTEGLFYDKESILLSKVEYDEDHNSARIEGDFVLDFKSLYWQPAFNSYFSYYELTKGEFSINRE